ncbi:MAG: sigma 54-interacting transcriptional regulator [Deltaproteobacteria bacterium]|jgi:two-component system NtrC family response regulator|nr:sigma 54-interacting transcriptional regulator [Deltaproteobacteria bacterium]
MTETVLVVDDEPNYRLIIGQVLEAQGWEVLEAGGGREAFDIFLGRPELALVLTDVTMPDGDGLELLTWVKAERPEVPVVLLTAHNDVKLAVEAMQKGAFDYLTKPYRNDDLIRSVAKALKVSALARQNRRLRDELSGRDRYGELVGRSRAMRDLFDLLARVAPSRANVLITGESGTGKELAARAIHQHSPRSDRPFVAVNCSALTETLLLSELFGYEKGAFTGAGQRRAGRFELAHQGTLFLDEIGELGSSVQVALLRVLQERVVERVGGAGSILEVDVRLVTATNRDLKREVAAGGFREDLFYRLNVVRVVMPPLRERLDDLPLLAETFLDKHGRDRERRPRLSQETMRLMYAYHWPGNVRELENVVERALVLAAGDEILPSDLPEELIRPGWPGGSAVAADGGGAGQGSGAGAGQGGGHGAGEGARQEQGAGLRLGAGSGLDVASANRPLARSSAGWLGDSPADPSKAASGTAPGGTPGVASGATSGQATASGTNLEAAAALEPGGSARPAGAARRVDGVSDDRIADGGVSAEVGAAVGAPVVSAAGEGVGWTWRAAELLPTGLGLTEALSALEEGLLRRAMGRSDGVQSRAADLLGLRRNVFKYKWDKYVGGEPAPLARPLAETAPEGPDLSTLLADFEEEMLRRALALAGGVQSRAADLLGLKRNTMPYKLNKYPHLLEGS